MATATTKTETGIKIPCMKCGATEALVLQIHDLALTCRECYEPVTRDDLRALAADALRVIRLMDLAETV